MREETEETEEREERKRRVPGARDLHESRAGESALECDVETQLGHVLLDRLDLRRRAHRQLTAHHNCCWATGLLGYWATGLVVRRELATVDNNGISDHSRLRYSGVDMGTMGG